MLTLPDTILPVLDTFASLFRRLTWRKAQSLLVGAVLATGQRTVASALRVMGLSDDRNYARFHHVLNRAAWSPLKVSRILLGLLILHLDRGEGPLIFGIDETLGRRRRLQISALGIYRDAVRSSRSHVVKASGLRWVSLMWLGHIPWAGRCWALPFLTVLAPSERYYHERGRSHKKVTDWARQMILQLRRWLPARPLVLVGDSGYAVLDLLHFCQSLREPVTLITRLRLDAGLYAPAPPRRPGQNGRPRGKGVRLPTLKELLNQSALSWTTAGPPRRWLGTAAAPAWWNSPHRPQSGITRATPPCPFAGCLSGTLKASSTPKRCCAPTQRWPRRRSWSDLPCAGNWRRHSRRCGLTWVWRPNASGQTAPLPVPRPS